MRTGTSNLQLPPRSPPSGFLLHQCSPAAKGTDTVFLVLSLFLCQCESEILPSQTRWVPLRLPPSDALAQTLLLSWPFPSNSVLNTQKSFSCRILYKTANCCALPISQSWGLRRVGLALHTVQARALTRPPSAGSLTGAARPEMASHPLGLFPHLGSLAHASWELLASKRENTEHVSPRFKAYVWKPPECHRCHGLLVQATSEGRLLFKLLTGRAAKHV